jgi:hypothetical protein
MTGMRILAILTLIRASTVLTLNTRQMYAITAARSLVRSRALGGTSGLTGAGSAGQSSSNVGGVDRHLFCISGVS